MSSCRVLENSKTGLVAMEEIMITTNITGMGKIVMMTIGIPSPSAMPNLFKRWKESIYIQMIVRVVVVIILIIIIITIGAAVWLPS